MSITRRAAAGLILVPALTAPALAQSLPLRRIIVPFPAGGAVDMMGRLMAEELQATAGGRVVVENIGGQGAMLGIAQVVQGPTDGSVMGLAQVANLILGKYLFQRMPYDPERDLIPLTRIATGTVMCVVNARVAGERGWGTLADMIAWARANPGRLNMGSSGNGQTSHLMLGLLNQRTGANITHVPYRGGGPAIADLLAGHIDLMFDVMPALMPHVRAGTFRALAVASATRNPAAPDVPSVREFPALNMTDVDFQTWWGMVVKTGTPTPIVQALHGAVVAATRGRLFVERTAEGGIVPVTDTTPEVFRELIRREDPFWREVVRVSGATIE